MKEEFDHPRSVSVEVFFQILDRAIALMPERLVIVRWVHKGFAAKQFWMHADNQYLLIVRSIEYSDAPALRQIAGGAPQEIMLQLCRTRVLEAEHLAPLR